MRRLHPWFHISKLRPYQKPVDAETEEKVAEAQAEDSDASDGEFEVEAIVDHRTRRGKRQFRIHWSGYPPHEDTWEPEEALTEASEALEEYWRSRAPTSTLVEDSLVVSLAGDALEDTAYASDHQCFAVYPDDSSHDNHALSPERKPVLRGLPHQSRTPHQASRSRLRASELSKSAGDNLKRTPLHAPPLFSSSTAHDLLPLHTHSASQTPSIDTETKTSISNTMNTDLRGQAGVSVPSTYMSGYPWEEDSGDFEAEGVLDCLGVAIATWVHSWVHQLRTNPNVPLQTPGHEFWLGVDAPKPYAVGQPLTNHIADPYSKATDGGEAVVGIVADAKKPGKRGRPAPCAAWLDRGVPQHEAGSRKMAPFTDWPNDDTHEFASAIIEAARTVLLRTANAAEASARLTRPRHHEHAEYHFRATNLKRAAETFTALYVTRTGPDVTPGTIVRTATDQIWFCCNVGGRASIIWVVNQDADEADPTDLVPTW
ncbi:uncharacterized protein SPPG_07840 [Spizellomyces punctatus DAOM BR117]|uniref:Chromo domain-containing protein n=1 Tax=Spizellomyces punctatus (strain DAOM BR117) TaxID=645134 RepID=A0A0L0H6Y1_SPIPD|nr:uncharacterized protein SPPG_07840 [Spizellomyces punctatus DAOM BR117]KNC96626.1 hypothetical protein SPPG_07840 [Spizellomyces punctatus DAOM BR117]|eukprot:XP_016604666.1 hypothetical protein SPPG_07840 [Spizellomyces punctatus DAOM BR117]